MNVAWNDRRARGQREARGAGAEFLQVPVACASPLRENQDGQSRSDTRLGCLQCFEIRSASLYRKRVVQPYEP